MSAERITRTLRDDLGAMHAYAVQPSEGFIKLDAMENPFRLPPALQRELGERLGAVAINRYPGARIDELKRRLAEHAALPDDCALMLGNGSDELISLLAMACDKPGATMLAPLPGFVMYELSAKLQGLRFVGVPLSAEFELDEAAMLAAIAQHRPAIIYLAYPNNPTANLWDDAVIDRIIQAAPGLVVMDEAYQPFAARDSMARLARWPQVLLMRTLSKFGLAGVRLGYLIGRREWIGQIDKLRPPYNVSVLNAEAALFALDHADEYARQAAEIRRERARVQAALARLPRLRAYASEANMILVRIGASEGGEGDDGPDAAAVFAGMKQHGVLIKNVSSMHPLLDQCLRLTVGTPQENDRMLQALQQTLEPNCR